MRIWEYIKYLPSGILGIVAAAFLYFALSFLIQVKEKRWCRGLLLFGCWIISFMIIYTGDMVNLSCSMVFFLVVLWITCEGTRLKKITLGLMFASTVFAFNGFYDNCVGFIAHSYGKDSLYADMYLTGRLFFAVFLYLTIRFQKAERDFELSAPLWRLLLLLTLPPFGIMLSVIVLRSPFMRQGETVLEDSVLFLVVILSFIGLLRALTVLERQKRLELENVWALQNQRYYEAMEQQQFEIRRLRHDLVNHLQTLLALPELQKEDYIRGMLDNPAFGQVFTWCGDTTVNAVLTAKGELMRQKGIRFLAKVDIGQELPYEKADICAIFANALDNAVEGCMELLESLREIHLDAKTGKGILAVNIRNACKSISANDEDESGGKNVFSGKTSVRNSTAGKAFLPKTTKRDTKNHGLGLRSIQETVKKYGGSMEIEQKEGNFNLFLYLPLN